MNTSAPKKRISPWIPGAAIIALLAVTASMPGAHAQWSDSSTIPRASISAGDLDLSMGGTAWTLNGVAFDPATQSLSAGDIVMGKTAVDVTLEGDNLRAQIEATVSSSGSAGTATGAIHGDKLLTQGGAVMASTELTWTGAPSYGSPDQVTTSMQADLKQERGGTAAGWSATESSSDVTFKGASVDVSVGAAGATSEADVLSIFRTGVPEAQLLDANGSYSTSVPVTATASSGTEVSWSAALPNYAAGTVFGDADVKVFTVASPDQCIAAGAPSAATGTVTSTADSTHLCFTAVKGKPAETAEQTEVIVTGETEGEEVEDTELFTVTVSESADPTAEPSTHGSFSHKLTGKK